MAPPPPRSGRKVRPQHRRLAGDLRGDDRAPVRPVVPRQQIPGQARSQASAAAAPPPHPGGLARASYTLPTGTPAPCATPTTTIIMLAPQWCSARISAPPGRLRHDVAQAVVRVASVRDVVEGQHQRPVNACTMNRNIGDAAEHLVPPAEKPISSSKNCRRQLEMPGAIPPPTSDDFPTVQRLARHLLRRISLPTYNLLPSPWFRSDRAASARVRHYTVPSIKTADISTGARKNPRAVFALGVFPVIGAPQMRALRPEGRHLVVGGLDHPGGSFRCSPSTRRCGFAGRSAPPGEFGASRPTSPSSIPARCPFRLGRGSQMTQSRQTDAAEIAAHSPYIATT